MFKKGDRVLYNAQSMHASHPEYTDAPATITNDPQAAGIIIIKFDNPRLYGGSSRAEYLTLIDETPEEPEDWML